MPEPWIIFVQGERREVFLEPLNRLTAKHTTMPVFPHDALSAAFGRWALAMENVAREAIGLAPTTWETAQADADALTPAHLAAAAAWIQNQEDGADAILALERLA